MRILINGTNYHPEKIGIGKYTGEMAEWLAAHGHEVRVVTAPPYYPEWQVAPGYFTWRYRREYKSGVDVWRCPLWVPKRLSGLKRILHLASFALSSLPIMLRQIFWKPDVVLAIEPPLMCAPAAWIVARLSGASAWLHIQDFEVDAAFDLGILRAVWLKQWALKAERLLMRRFDRVSTISAKMLAKLDSKGVAPDKKILFPNWVDLIDIHPLEKESLFRSHLDLLPGQVVALYSGNMGEKQGLEIVLEAADKLVGNSDIRFVLCGDGSAKLRLQKEYAGLSNVNWLPLQPLEMLNQLLNMADIHLLPQRGDVADLVMPSKLLGMLASGRPVVTTAKPGTQLASVVEGKGIIVAPDNIEAFANAVSVLADDSALRAKMGTAAREYAVTYLGKQSILAEFERLLFELINERRRDAQRL